MYPKHAGDKNKAVNFTEQLYGNLAQGCGERKPELGKKSSELHAKALMWTYWDLDSDEKSRFRLSLLVLNWTISSGKNFHGKI